MLIDVSNTVVESLLDTVEKTESRKMAGSKRLRVSISQKKIFPRAWIFYDRRVLLLLSVE